ncbi:chemotaxis protein CheB [Sphingosinicella terrae]|uniref:chemotaxis protein CheB n=1 Tax=Sphingosinicella terrae TaxID=2172047 RepID=UPI000E0CD6D1|nr:chemotaxis protein CheB [Sphingosinicella terrae]
MVVEDSAVVRTLLSHIIRSDPRLEMAAAVSSAEEAIAALPAVRPDVISMDIRLPGMDGLAATRQIMADCPTPIVVISASIDKSSMKTTMDALSAGALSVVEKPVGLGNEDYAAVSREICTQLAIMSQVAVVRHRIRPRSADSAVSRPRTEPKVLLCAASTGGPQALARLFGMLPADLGLPVLLVQHMGGTFMSGFAAWLQTVVPQRVVLAEAGQAPAAGTIHVAPGDRHLLLDRGGLIALSAAAPVGGQRPSANLLLQSAAETLGGGAAAIVLTGMGEDGAAGVRALLAAGGFAIAEHESSAIVNGMPAAAVRAGALALPLDLIAPHVRRILEREVRA